MNKRFGWCFSAGIAAALMLVSTGAMGAEFVIRPRGGDGTTPDGITVEPGDVVVADVFVKDWGDSLLRAGQVELRRTTFTSNGFTLELTDPMQPGSEDAINPFCNGFAQTATVPITRPYGLWIDICRRRCASDTGIVCNVGEFVNPTCGPGAAGIQDCVTGPGDFVGQLPGLDITQMSLAVNRELATITLAGNVTGNGAANPDPTTEYYVGTYQFKVPDDATPGTTWNIEMYLDGEGRCVGGEFDGMACRARRGGGGPYNDCGDDGSCWQGICTTEGPHLGEICQVGVPGSCGGTTCSFLALAGGTGLRDENSMIIPTDVYTGFSITIPSECDGIVGANPTNCAIDARQPTTLTGEQPNDREWGFRIIELEMPGCDVGVEDFTVESTGGTTPVVDSVSVDGDIATVTLDTWIPVGEWTTITHVASGTTVTYGYLPGDTNQDQAGGPTDITYWIDLFNGVAQGGIWQSNIDRSLGGNPVGPPDLLRVIDLLNGADALDRWFGERLPDNDLCP